MNRCMKQLVYILFIFKISSANPTRIPEIIEQDEDIKFQNKLPEDSLEYQNIGVVEKPSNNSKHRTGQLEYDQSILRENEKHHCPFCQYAANTKESVENQDHNSESTQPYLVIGEINPGIGQPNIVTQEEGLNDDNSTWNPQNEIREILKIPDDSSPVIGKEFKRCTHSDGSLQKTKLSNKKLNDLVALSNIDISCCSALRRIILNALKLEGKCSCSENRATSPVITITAINDNEFQRQTVRHEFPSTIGIQQRRRLPPKLKIKKGIEYISLGNKEFTEHDELNTTSIKKENANKTDSIIGKDGGLDSDGPDFTFNTRLNTPLTSYENRKEINDLLESNTHEEPRTRSGNHLATLTTMSSLITESRTDRNSSTEIRKEPMLRDSTSESSNLAVKYAVEITSENSFELSTESNEKNEQLMNDPKKILEEQKFGPTGNIYNKTQELFRSHEFDSSSLKKEMNTKLNIGDFNETTKDYTTEYSLSLMGIEKPNSTNGVQHSSETKMPFNHRVPQKEVPTQELKLGSTDINMGNSSVEKANYTSEVLQEVSVIQDDLLQTEADIHSKVNETLSLKQDTFLDDIENQSFSSTIVDRNIPTSTSLAVNLMEYQTLENETMKNYFLEEPEPHYDVTRPEAFERDSSIISTIAPEKSSEFNETEFTEKNQNLQEMLNYTNSLDAKPSKLQDGNLGKFYETASIVQDTRTQTMDTLVGNKITSVDRESSVEIASNIPEISTHQLTLEEKNSSSSGTRLQQTPPTEILTINDILESPAEMTSNSMGEYDSPIFTDISFSTESILQETESSTKTSMENGMPTVTEENTNSNYHFSSAESILKRTQPTDILLEDKRVDLSTDNFNSSDPMSQLSHTGPTEINNQKVDNPLENGGHISTDEPKSNNYILISDSPTGEVESRTRPTEWTSSLFPDYSSEGLETYSEATAPTVKESFITRSEQKSDNQDQINSTDNILKESLSQSKKDIDEFLNENSTEINLELENAENILKIVTDGFKKTYMDVNDDDSKAIDDPVTSMMKYDTPLEEINNPKLPNTTKVHDEKVINMENYTETNENSEVDEYSTYLGLNATDEDWNSSPQSQQISSTIAYKEILESFTTHNDNLKEIQDSSKLNETSSFNNIADNLNEDSARIDEFDQFSKNNYSSKIKNLEEPSSTVYPELLSTDTNSHTSDNRDINKELPPSIIKLLSPHSTGDDVFPMVTHTTEIASSESELQRSSDLNQEQDTQEITKPNLDSLILGESNTATTNTKSQESEPNLLKEDPEEDTKSTNWNNVVTVKYDSIPEYSTNRSLYNNSEQLMSQLNSTILEEEILSTGNYLEHNVNVSINKDSEDMNHNLPETLKPNLKLEGLEITTMFYKNDTENKISASFNHLSSGSDDSHFIESMTSSTAGDNDDANLAQMLTTTEISELKVHSPIIVCIAPDQMPMANHLDNDLLSSRFFVQKGENVVEFDIVGRNVSDCGCPHPSYELQPKSRVSKADLNLLKSLQGQHISKILRRAHEISDKNDSNDHGMTTENKYSQKVYLDFDEKDMNGSDKTESNSGNLAPRKESIDDHTQSSKLNENNSCKCKCFSHIDPSKTFLDSRKDSQTPREVEVKNSGPVGDSKNIMTLDTLSESNAAKPIKRGKYNRANHQPSARRAFPIKIDRDILRRFMSVYRQQNYFRRS